MERCGPVEMRKNLMLVDELRRAGIDFVPIPAVDEAHKRRLITQSQSVLESMTAGEDLDGFDGEVR